MTSKASSHLGLQQPYENHMGHDYDRKIIPFGLLILDTQGCHKILFETLILKNLMKKLYRIPSTSPTSGWTTEFILLFSRWYWVLSILLSTLLGLVIQLWTRSRSSLCQGMVIEVSSLSQGIFRNRNFSKQSLSKPPNKDWSKRHDTD